MLKASKQKTLPTHTFDGCYLLSLPPHLNHFPATLTSSNVPMPIFSYFLKPKSPFLSKFFFSFSLVHFISSSPPSPVTISPTLKLNIILLWNITLSQFELMNSLAQITLHVCYRASFIEQTENSAFNYKPYTLLHVIYAYIQHKRLLTLLERCLLKKNPSIMGKEVRTQDVQSTKHKS